MSVICPSSGEQCVVRIQCGQDGSAYRSLCLPKVVPAEDTQEIPAIITLDPSDAFEAALIRMVTTNRAKRADYATDGDIFSNFREVGSQMNFAAVKSVDTLIATKQARLKALDANGRGPLNESLIDTYLDRAVYSVIALALLTEAAPEAA